MSHSEQKEPRKPYQAPTLTEVPLRPEEAVLGNCKVSGASGPNTGGTCASPKACALLGS